MLNATVAFFALAIVAAFVVFGGLAADAAVWTSKTALVTFLFVAALWFLAGRKVLSA